MKLRFHARGDALVAERHADGTSFRLSTGTYRRFVGRSWDAEKHGYPANAEPFECESDSALAEYLARTCRDGDLFAADEATAAACGVKFVPVELREGVWLPKSDAPAAPAPRQPARLREAV